MRRSLLPALVLIVLLGVNPVFADDGFYVVAMGGVGTKITSLPYSITKPGFYYLGGDLTSTGHGITVNANDVTIDLMGFSLNFTGTSEYKYGVLMLGKNNVEIRNGTVRGFSSGINENQTTGYNHRVINVRAVYNAEAGIVLLGNAHVIKGCTSSYNYFGIVIIGSGKISHCVAYHNTIGIQIEGAGNCIDNHASYNSTHNYYLGKANTNTPLLVSQNSASDSPINYYIPGGSLGVLLKDNVP
jgi:hypothetical protein